MDSQEDSDVGDLLGAYSESEATNGDIDMLSKSPECTSTEPELDMLGGFGSDGDDGGDAAAADDVPAPLAVAMPEAPLVAVEAALPECQKLRRASTYSFGAPSKRSKTEQFLLAALMRERKAEKRANMLETSFLEECAAILRKSTSNRKVRRKIKIARKKWKRRRFTSRFRLLLASSRIRSLQGGRGHLDYSFDLDIAFDKLRRNDNANANSMDPKTVRRSQICVAKARLDMDTTLLDELEEKCLKVHPLAVFDGLKWDTAKITLTMKLPERILELIEEFAECSAWDVLIVRRMMVIVWHDHTEQHEVLVPPSVMTSTCASASHDALFDQEKPKAIENRIQAIKDTAIIQGRGLGSDGAFSCMKLCAHVEDLAWKKRGNNTMVTRVRCMNHAVHLIEVALTKMASKRFVARLYCLSSLLRMGGHFCRLRQAVAKLIDQRMVIKVGSPDADVVHIANTLKNYFVHVYLAFKYAHKVGKNHDEARRRAQARYEELWTEFFRWWNGSLFDDVIVHWTDDPTKDRSTVIWNMSSSLKRVLLACYPSKPESGKWTKVGPCLDWCSLLYCSGLLRELLREALGAFSTDVVVGSVEGDGVSQEMNWHEVVGKKAAEVDAFIHDKCARIELMSLVVVLDVIRYLTTWFLRRSSETFLPTSTPAILDLAAAEHSPATIVAQYLSALLAGEAPMVQVLCAAFKCADWETFLAQKPEEAAFFCGTVRAAAAWNEVRVVEPFQCTAPFKWAGLADGRTDLSSKMRLANEVSMKPTCCTGIVGKVLKARTDEASDLLREQWSLVLYWWYWLLSWLISIGDIERRHRRSKCIAHQGDVSFVNFAAVSVAREAESIAQVDKVYQQGVPESPAEPLPCPGPRDVTNTKKALSVYECYRKDLWQEIKDGKATWWEEQPAESKSQRMRRFHAIAKHRFQRVTNELMVHYQCRAAISKVTASVNRQRFAIAHGSMDEPGAAIVPLQARQELPMVALAVDQPPPRRGTAFFLDPPISIAGWPTSTQDENTMCPFHPEWYLHARARDGSKNKSVKEFQRNVLCVATDKHCVPKRVQYRKCCGSTCAATGDSGIVQMVKQTTARLLQLRARVGCTISQLPKFEFMVAIELSVPYIDAVKTTLLSIGILSRCAGQSGPMDSSFSLQELDFVGQDFPSEPPETYVGLDVAPRRARFIESTRSARSWFDARGHGPLAFFTEADLRKKLQPIMLVAADRLQEVRLRLRFLDFRRHGGNAYTITAHRSEAPVVNWRPPDGPVDDFVFENDDDESDGDKDVELGVLVDADIGDVDDDGVDVLAGELEALSSDDEEALDDMPDAPAADDGAEEISHASICRSLSIVDTGPKVFSTMCGTPLGRFEVASTISISAKCVCDLHPGCSLFLFAQKNYYDKAYAVLKWLRDGLGVTKQEHMDMAVAVKRSFGVRVRAKATAASSSGHPSASSGT